jgi:YVTN family beta-propeller protein
MQHLFVAQGVTMRGPRQYATVVLGTIAVVLGVAVLPALPAAATTTYAITGSIPVGAFPFGVAENPVTHTVYVSNMQDNTLSVIDETTNTVTATIPAGTDPVGVGVDPSTNTIYVADDLNTNTGDGVVTVIDGTTGTITATIPVDINPTGVAVDPTTHTVYVTNLGGDNTQVIDGTVSVIDGTTNTVTADVHVGAGQPFGIAVDPTTHTVYVANFTDSTVVVINGTTNTVADTINLPGSTPIGVAVDPSTHTVYVAAQSALQIAVIDEATNTVTAHIPDGSAPFMVAVDPSTHAVYVTNGTGDFIGPAGLMVIDGTTNTVATFIDDPNGSAEMGVDPATHTVYMSEEHTNTVSVITPVVDNDLAIAQPANVTTDATGPAGATVSYPAPVVTDPDDASPPAATCSPASGTVFAIGTTTVTCTATDAGDSNSPASTSFTVTVQGAAAQLADLRHAVQGVGVGHVLADTVAVAQHQLAAGHTRLACLTLTAFIVEVQFQTPRFIPPATAAALIADARQIRAVIGCT